MSFKPQRTSSSKLFANLEILKFDDMVHLQNTLFLHNLYHKNLPVSVQNAYAIDFSHGHNTCANELGLVNLPMVDSISFGKNSNRVCAINSWNLIQSSLPDNLFRRKFTDLERETKSLFFLPLINLL